MANILGKFLGLGKKTPSQNPNAYAESAEAFGVDVAPSPVSDSLSPSFQTLAASTPVALSHSPLDTKWYRVWERMSPKDFYFEAMSVPFIFAFLFLHYWGRRTNRKKASDWAQHHVPALEAEFEQVGIEQNRKSGSAPETALCENTASEWITYATGRQNIAFADVKLNLNKRYNPLLVAGEQILGLFFESLVPLPEHVEITCYAFDSREAEIVPRNDKLAPPVKTGNSSFDPFVWAIVNKRILKRIKQDRYDLGLTSAKDHEDLPSWATTLSENAEITSTMLTPELAKAVADASELFDALIVSDQPLNKPETLEEAQASQKRITLVLRLPSSHRNYVSTMPIYAYFLRLTDVLVKNAHFRPEVQRKVRGTREAEVSRIKKAEEAEKATKRREQLDKEKKKQRDASLRALDAEGQKKFLEKEKAKEMSKLQKKMTVRG